MTLANKAQKLIKVLESVVEALNQYSNPDKSSYTHDLANRLRPFVIEYKVAVLNEHDRDRAKNILSDIIEIMHEVNGAVTKGDLDIFHDDTLDRYWDLRTIFQESRYSGQKI